MSEPPRRCTDEQGGEQDGGDESGREAKARGRGLGLVCVGCPGERAATHTKEREIRLPVLEAEAPSTCKGETREEYNSVNGNSIIEYGLILVT